MKYNKNIRKKLLNKLAFDPGNFQVPQVNVEDLMKQPLQEEEVAPANLQAPVNTPMQEQLQQVQQQAVSSAVKAEAQKMIHAAAERIVEEFLQSIEDEVNAEFGGN